ncbi:MAG: YggS family pyridoxal phosphate-dependent enzyme [Candidatus Bathyarchaeota archaeon]|nr:YggS family pyridoxal phosphate-dependent enzyme [Candidatus Bathyarchaeota archaeon]
MSIADNLRRVRERVAAACERAGRSPDEVTIVGVGKTFPPEAIAEACRAGLADIGENRVQEALRKIPLVEAHGLHPRWHLVGHLQTNKAKTAVSLFAIIHSVDSLHLAEALSKRADQPVPVLLEVNVAGEASKFGFAPEEVAQAYRQVAALPNLDLQGLMTVAPFVTDPEEVRPLFRRLRELRDELGLRELSMGMTDDFEVAIDEGATMVRIGRAIFGPRPLEE